jgi:hyperosmotically inducible periplasmic protein
MKSDYTGNHHSSEALSFNPLSSIKVILALLAIAALSFAPAARAQEHNAGGLQGEVLHELRMLPYITIFDNLEFQVNGSQVTLMGQVVRPDTKSEAENVVKKIQGVSAVQNNIEVLPASEDDDQIRRAELRSISSDSSLQQYLVGTQPSIHIIVKNGNVTLEGFVNNQADRDAANVKANTVPNVFSVTNNLRVQPS